MHWSENGLWLASAQIVGRIKKKIQICDSGTLVTKLWHTFVHRVSAYRVHVIQSLFENGWPSTVKISGLVLSGIIWYYQVLWSDEAESLVICLMHMIFKLHLWLENTTKHYCCLLFNRLLAVRQGPLTSSLYIVNTLTILLNKMSSTTYILLKSHILLVTILYICTFVMHALQYPVFLTYVKDVGARHFKKY